MFLPFGGSCPKKGIEIRFLNTIFKHFMTSAKLHLVNFIFYVCTCVRLKSSSTLAAKSS